MKKFFSVLILIGLILTLFGCGAAEKNSGKAQSPEQSDMDFSGSTFIIRDGDDYGSIYCPNYGDNLISDQMLDWLKELQTRYDVELKTERGTLADLQKAAAAWSHYGDLMNFRNNNTYKAYKAGFLSPLEEVPGIELHSGKYGPESLLQNLHWNGDTVAFWPAYWGIDLPCFSDALMYNPRLAEEYVLGDPQEYYEKGQWNWNTYEQMARQMSDAGSIQGENPVYFSCYDTYTLRLALYSNGAEFVTPDPDGNLILSLDTPEAIQAIDWFMQLEKIDSFLTWSGDNNATNQIFYKGNMLFFPEYSMTGLKVSGGLIGSNMEEEWHYCYYPVGHSGTAEDVKRGHFSQESRFLSVLKLTDDIDTLGPFMEILFAPTFETEDGWKDSFLSTNFFEEFSQQYYMTKWENIRFDYSSFYGTEFNTLMSALVHMAGSSNQRMSSLSSVLDAYGDKIQTILDQAFEK